MSVLTKLFLLSIFSDHFVSPVTDNLLFFNKWKREKSMKECVTRKCRSWVCLQMTQLQCLMCFHAHHAILCNPNKFIFGHNKNFWYLLVPLNNLASTSNFPWVKGKFNKPPPSLEVCVWRGGANSYSMIKPLFLVS